MHPTEADETNNNNNPKMHVSDQQLLLGCEPNIVKYRGAHHSARPRLPRIKPTFYTRQILRRVNEIVKVKVANSDNLENTNLVIYCAALTVCQTLNLKIGDLDQINTCPEKQISPWEKRLITQIENLRKKAKYSKVSYLGLINQLQDIKLRYKK